MENKETILKKILGYILKVGKTNKYRIASALKINTGEVAEALDELEKEGKIETSGGATTLIKEPKVNKKSIEEKAETLEEKQKLSIEEKQKLVLGKLKEAIRILEE